MKKTEDCFLKVKDDYLKFLNKEKIFNKSKAAKIKSLKETYIPMSFWIEGKYKKKGETLILGFAGGQGSGKTTVTGILKIGDGSTTDNYAGFGDADDLKIFHNGSHSIIRETGTGSLYLQSDGNVILGKDTGSEFFVRGIADGAVELYHDNTKKFETTANGVSVTGNLAADGSQIDFTSLPTSDPGVAGRLFRSGNDVKISTG